MIISHEYKYLFIEVPLTGSWAIHKELCQYYGGKEILHKHANYIEYLNYAQGKPTDYFVFAGIRHPADIMVSRYIKLKHNHKGAFSAPDSVDKSYIDYSDLKKYAYIQNENASFEMFFREFCTRPYSDILDISPGAIDFIIRFENLQNDFSQLLQRLGIQQVRPIPVINKTEGKTRPWESYYTAEIIPQAKKVLGPFMNKWDYEFPAGWGEYNPNALAMLEYRLVSILRNFYIKHLRYNDSASAKLLRRIRARVIK